MFTCDYTTPRLIEPEDSIPLSKHVYMWLNISTAYRTRRFETAFKTCLHVITQLNGLYNPKVQYWIANMFTCDYTTPRLIEPESSILNWKHVYMWLHNSKAYRTKRFNTAFETCLQVITQLNGLYNPKVQYRIQNMFTSDYTTQRLIEPEGSIPLSKHVYMW